MMPSPDPWITNLLTDLQRLRAGEDDTPAEPGTALTPGQWIRMWNDATADQRLAVASAALANAEQARRCFQMDHEGRLADVDALLGALQHPRLLLSGDEEGGVSIHCRDHFDGGRPFAYYSTGSTYPDETVRSVATIPSLWAEAVKHLQDAHGDGDSKSHG